MKTFGTIMKILAALAAIAGAIYVFATYGDRITVWARKLLDKVNNLCCCREEAVIFSTADAPVQEDTVQAEETDFEG